MMSRKEYMYSTGKTAQIESQNTFVCERAIFGGFNSFTVKKVSFFTINVKFKVILSSKSGGGGGMFVQAIPPTQKSGGIHPPPSPPPGIYASANKHFNRNQISSADSGVARIFPVGWHWGGGGGPWVFVGGTKILSWQDPPPP